MRKMIFQSVTKVTWKKRVEPINDLLVTSLETLPLSYERLVGAETSKLQQVFVTKVLFIVRSKISICARENNGT